MMRGEPYLERTVGKWAQYKGPERQTALRRKQRGEKRYGRAASWTPQKKRVGGVYQGWPRAQKGEHQELNQQATEEMPSGAAGVEMPTLTRVPSPGSLPF